MEEIVENYKENTDASKGLTKKQKMEALEKLKNDYYELTKKALPLTTKGKPDMRSISSKKNIQKAHKEIHPVIKQVKQTKKKIKEEKEEKEEKESDSEEESSDDDYEIQVISKKEKKKKQVETKPDPVIGNGVEEPRKLSFTELELIRKEEERKKIDEEVFRRFRSLEEENSKLKKNLVETQNLTKIASLSRRMVAKF